MPLTFDLAIYKFSQDFLQDFWIYWKVIVARRLGARRVNNGHLLFTYPIYLGIRLHISVSGHLSNLWDVSFECILCQMYL